MTDSKCFWSCVAKFFEEWKMFQTKVVEKIKYTFCVQLIHFKNPAVYEIMWKNTVEPDRSQDVNMAQARCTLDT